eukprot:44359-Pyramimonas_sp.AAC.1
MWGGEETGRAFRSPVGQRFRSVDCAYPVHQRRGCRTGRCGAEGREGLRCVRGDAAARMLFEVDVGGRGRSRSE